MKRFTWTESAKADLRRIERNQALDILKALARFARDGFGDVKKLVDDPKGRYRLRIGDWRVYFRFESGGVIHVVGVENRKDAYR